MCDTTLLRNLSSEDLYTYIHLIIDELCGMRGPEMSDYVPKIWSNPNEFNNARQTLKNLLPNAIDVRGKHENLLQFPEEFQRVIHQCVETRRGELKNAIVTNAIAENNAILKDFYWKLNMVLASDKMTNVNEPLLNLELNISHDSCGDKLVSLELDREELNHLIKSLEDAHQTLKEHY